MKTKNLYYREVFGRSNAIKNFFYAIFLGLASFPRLILETFLRKNFGQRYFSFSTAVILFMALAILPYASAYARSYGDVEYLSFLFKNITWYVFLGAFLYYAIKRKNEIKRLPSVFDFGHFSLSSGVVDKRFYEIKIKGKYVDIRTIETLLEPALCLIIGILLLILQQPLGILITICSILYSGSYFASYNVGDNFVMDKIDEIICSEELYETFVDGRNNANSRGFNYTGRKPADPELKRKLVDSFFEIDEDFKDAA